MDPILPFNFPQLQSRLSPEDRLVCEGVRLLSGPEARKLHWDGFERTEVISAPESPRSWLQQITRSFAGLIRSDKRAKGMSRAFPGPLESSLIRYLNLE